MLEFHWKSFNDGYKVQHGFPSFVLHDADICPDGAIEIRRGGHVVLVQHVLRLTVVVVEGTADAIVQDGKIQTEIKFFFLFPFKIGVSQFRNKKTLLHYII